MTTLSPKATVTSSASNTSLPERSPWLMFMVLWLRTSRRALRSKRSFSNERTLPSLRVRRALIPWRIHTSSSASFFYQIVHFVVLLLEGHAVFVRYINHNRRGNFLVGHGQDLKYV